MGESDDTPRGAKTVVTDKAAWAQYMRNKRAEWKRRRLAAAEARAKGDGNGDNG